MAGGDGTRGGRNARPPRAPMLTTCWWPCAAASGPLECSQVSCASSRPTTITAIVNVGDDMELHGLPSAPTSTRSPTPWPAWTTGDRLGRGRRELDGHGRTGAPGRRRLVPPGRPRPGHASLPHRPAARRRPAERGHGRAGTPARALRCASCPSPTTRCAPGWSWPSDRAGPARDRGQLPGLLRPAAPRRGGARRALRRRRQRPAGARRAWRRSRRRAHRRVPFESRGLHRPRSSPSPACARPWWRAGTTWWRSRPSWPAPRSRDRPTGSWPSWEPSRPWSAWPGCTRPGWARWSSTSPTPPTPRAVEAEGLRCVVTPTVMHSPERAEALARAVVDAAGLRACRSSPSPVSARWRPAPTWPRSSPAPLAPATPDGPELASR